MLTLQLLQLKKLTDHLLDASERLDTAQANYKASAEKFGFNDSETERLGDVAVSVAENEIQPNLAELKELTTKINL